MAHVKNILFITIDQWRFEAWQNRSSFIPTPNLTKFAKKAIDFQRHYSVTAPCGPSRASMLSGLYAHTHRAVHNGSPLSKHIQTLGDVARTKGVWPVLMGYTDTAPDPRFYHPNDPRFRNNQQIASGFDALNIYEELNLEWREYLRDKKIDIGETPADLFAPSPASIKQNADNFYCQHPARFAAQDSFTHYYTDKARYFLNSPLADDPFLLHLTYLPPHPPYIVPAPYNTLIDPAKVALPNRHASIEDEASVHASIKAMLAYEPSGGLCMGDERDITAYSDAEIRALRAIYYGMVAEVDNELGRLFTILEQRQLFDNTMIIITSDHGDLLGDHYLQGKKSYFTESYHVPLLLYHPHCKGGTTINAITETVDLMPTMLTSIGADIPANIQGKNLYPLLTGEAGFIRHEYHQYGYIGSPNDALHQDMLQSIHITPQQSSFDIISDDAYRYVHFAHLPPLLFDMQKDPHCLHNLANENAYLAIKYTYADKLLRFRQQTDDATFDNIVYNDKF